MITFVFSPWGIPANYREMQGSGVNTYKWVNAEGQAVLIKYHWEPKLGIRNLTQKEAEAIQAKKITVMLRKTFMKRSSAAIIRNGSCTFK